jgi:hypothetical protein
MTQEVSTIDTLASAAIHRPHQSESLRREIQALEWALHGRSEHNGAPMPQMATGDDPQSREYIQESLARTRKLYESHSAESWAERFNGYQKNQLYRELIAAEADIVEGMPTHEMMHDATSTNVDWWMAWHREKKPKILFWRNARRILDPRNDNHNFGNVDILRKNELRGGDPRRYWTGYEQIAFTERVEEAIDQITDEQYYVFLTLRAQDWAPKNIMRKLGWTRATYEAALAKLRVSAGTPPPDDDDEPKAPVPPPDDDEDDGVEQDEPDDEDERVQVPTQPLDAPAASTRAHPAEVPMRASSEWRRLLAERGITHKTAARYIYMTMHLFKARMQGRGRFTDAQARKLDELIRSKEPVSPAA